MANQLKMALIEALLSLHRRGWSQRRIASELNVDRETVARWRATSARRPRRQNQPGRLPARRVMRRSQNQPRRLPARSCPRGPKASSSRRAVFAPRTAR